VSPLCKGRKSDEVGKRGMNNRKSKFFTVPADEIRSNKYDLSISRYKQIVHKEIEYEKPDAIMNKIAKLEKEIAEDIEDIKAMI
jgi:type I restriction enzyme M protein